MQTELQREILQCRIICDVVKRERIEVYMGEVVNKITIIQTSVSEGKEKGTYKAELDWRLNGGSGCSYEGSYTMLLLEKGNEKNTYTFQDTGGIHHAEIELKGLDKNQKYSVILKANQGSTPVSSQENALLLQVFENIRGSYDGDEFIIFWDKADSSIVKGELTLWSEQGAAFTCEVPLHSNYIRIDGIGFYPGERIWLSMEGNNGGNAFGPESNQLEFYADACEILSLDCRQEEEKAEIEICMEAWQDTQETNGKAEPDTVRLVFLKYGRECLCLSDIEVQNDERLIKVQVSVPYTLLQKEELTRCELFCYRQKENAVSRIKAYGNHRAVTAPQFVIRHRDAQKVQVEWEYQGEYEPDFFVTDSGTKIYGREYTITYKEAENFKIAAGFYVNGKTARGSFAELTGLFQEGYYPVLQDDKTMALIYHQADMSEKSVTQQFDCRLFHTEPEFPVVFGGISLKKQEGSYFLSTDTESVLSIKDYKDFLKKIGGNITPYGFYLVTEALARMSYQKFDDMPYIFFGYEKKSRICDLRPGSILEVQTELYMPQENPDIDDGAGFVSTFCTEYDVSFPMDENGTFLEFNSFADGFADAMNVSFGAGDDNVVFGGGPGDFLIPKMRQPFYRIMYPAQLPDSSLPENGYPSDHVILLAADTYGSLLEATESVLSDSSNVNHLSIPVLMFRGRSTMTASIRIVVNGETRKVPAGITLGKVLQQLGIYYRKKAVYDTLRIYRRSPSGKKVPVYKEWTECRMEDLVMAMGDRIEV